LYVAFACACGGNTSQAPTAPSTPSSPAPAPPSPGTFTYQYDDAVSVQDRGYIESAVFLGRDFFQTQFGRGIVAGIRVTVRVSDPGYSGQGGGNTLNIYTENAGWKNVGRIQKTRTVVHEMFHILQSEVAWPQGPTWLVEGPAEYAGYGAVAAGGMATSDEIRTCQADKYVNGGGASVPPLEDMDWSLNGPSQRYLIAWLAVDKLLATPGISMLRRYWEAGGDWSGRFTSAFGQAPTDFFRDFAAFRQSLRGAGRDVCSRLISN
jgi:hypothetical protein